MGLRFYRRVTILPGLKLNLSRSGPSLSIGARGAHVTFGPRGVTRTIGLPGTGIYYTSRTGHHTGVHSGLGAAGADRQGASLWPAVLLIAGLVLPLALLGR